MPGGASLDQLETAALDGLRAVLTGWLPSGLEIVRAEDNRVPEPTGPDFIEMSPAGRERMGTPIVTYDDPPSRSAIGPSVAHVLQPTQITVRLDVHGPDSADLAQTVVTLLRSPYAETAFAALPSDIQPLYSGDAQEQLFVNAEQQMERRWQIDVVMQGNATVTVAQDFAGTIDVGLILIP